MHALFNDDMCIYFDKGNGRVVYNWQYVDEVYDRMLDAGVRPFVELSFFPKALARDNSLMYWAFTDIFEEKGGGEEIFHGGFGLINFQGIVKPSFHAFRMMHKLGDELLYYTEPLLVSRDSHTGKVTAIAYNYPEEYIGHVPAAGDIKHCMEASSKALKIKLTGLEPGAHFMIETLDADHGNVIKEYKRLGKPHSPNRAETAALRDYARQTLKETVAVASDGSLDISRALSPWSLVLITEL